MQRAQHFAALLSLTAALIASGCKKPVADDATVTAAVQTRIAGDPALGAESIQSSVQGGVVTLNGAASSDAARVLAANDAAQVPGVRTVVNNITVATTAAVSTVPPTPLPSAAAPAPSVAVNTLPTRIRTLPSKPSAAGDRRDLARNNPLQQTVPPSQSAQLEHPAPQPAATFPPAPTFRNVEIPAGASIPVRITQTLDSATTQQGETFSGTVASDVLVDGVVVIPQGSNVSGRVDAVQEAAHFRGNSLLTVSLTNVSRRGERIPISTEAYSKEGAGRGKNTAVKTGIGAAAGAVLGGIFGGGTGAAIGAAAGGGTGAGINAVTRGQQVQIPSESLVPFRLSSAINVRVLMKGDGRSRDRQDRQDRQDRSNQPDQQDPANQPDQPNPADQPSPRRPLGH